jgi:MOSC domain-containing protein YiiM
MPALKPTRFVGEIVWLGSVETTERVELWSAAADRLNLTFAGVGRSVHSGLTRPSCSRVTAQHSKGTEIRNTRQLSIVSSEELDEIAGTLGLPEVDPARLGATIVVRGIPDLTHVPPSSRLQSDAGTTLVVDMENRPCQFPGRSLEAEHPGHGKGFKSAAAGRRGVTAWVEREGHLTLGDRLTLHVPDQPVWTHLEAARSD